MRRDEELEAFKRINLTLVAAELGGYSVVRKKSTRHSVLMESGNDKIIVSKNGDHFVYCSVHDPASNGTAIDFIQNVVDRNCSLGRVRQHLRPFLSGSYVSQVQASHAGKYVEAIKPSNVDFLSLAARFSGFEPITSPHAYLCGARGIPFELLQHPRVKGLVRCSPRHGSVMFPHWGQPSNDPSDDARCLVGYEIKDQNVSMFSREGRKGLFITRAFDHDRCLVFTEGGVDSLSYLAANNCVEHTRVASIAGQLNLKFQVPLIKSAIESMPSNSSIIAGFDADDQGDRLIQQLADIVISTGRGDLEFHDHRPVTRGQDWNDALQATEAKEVDDRLSSSQEIRPLCQFRNGF
ncbi:MAG: toprim domain-containing protein [Planctomycetaceae bacterium]|nr:toprim domain-containing protein [Planctomycetaceae bacterium]